MALDTNTGNFTPDERIVSPGVFTREIDQSALAQGVASIGGVVVAPFPKGPGFFPTVVTSQDDLTRIFGTPDGVLYGPYTAQQYLQQQGQVTICRVGGLAGYTQHEPLFITALPGQYSRFQENDPFTGSTIGAVITNQTGTSSFDIQGSLLGTFTSGAYAGTTMVIGTISGSVVLGAFTASLVNSLLPVDPINPAAPVAKGIVTLITVSPCKTEATFVGFISGSFGLLNSASWVAGFTSSVDLCGGITASASIRDEVVLAVLANTALDRGQNLYGFEGSILSASAEALSANYALNLIETHYDSQISALVSSSYGVYNFSMDDSTPAYLTSVFGTDPEAGFVPVPVGVMPQAAYTYVSFPNKTEQVINEMLASGSWKIVAKAVDNAMVFADGITPDMGTSTYDLREAATPFIRSQLIAPWSGSSGSSAPAYDLFCVHTLSDGTNTNTMFKIEISNVRSPGSVSGTAYGSFSLSVRAYGDTDQRVNILERYDNLTLDPTSANFVARRIGDMYGYIDYNGKIIQFGDFTNVSKLVRIEMATSPYPVNAIPFGFGPYASPFGGSLATLGKLPAMTYTSASAWVSQPGRYASGVVFQPAPGNADANLAALYPNGSAIGSERDNKQYFNPVPQGASVISNKAFDLEGCGVTPLYVPSDEGTNVRKRRFVLGFQGGFDGQSPSIPILVGDDIIPQNQQGMDCATSTSTGSYAYRQALSALGNSDEWDFNLITVPGINYQDHPYVASSVIDMIESRGDAFYILDIAPNQLAGDASVNNVVDLAATLDTNYAATYYPWVKILDVDNNQIVPVPPSVPMMAVYAANDSVAAEWFAPAGLNRGGIPSAVQVMDRLTHVERDTLYEGKVNPIASFPGQGIVAWGQKTLQTQASALDRINVRRLLIALKKFIASSSRFLVFEQNVATTRQRFLNIVNPYMEGVQQRSGIYAFKVQMDASNNTPDIIDRNILYGQIWLQPAKTAEFVVLDFTITPTGASFSA